MLCCAVMVLCGSEVREACLGVDGEAERLRLDVGERLLDLEAVERMHVLVAAQRPDHCSTGPTVMHTVMATAGAAPQHASRWLSTTVAEAVSCAIARKAQFLMESPDVT